MARSKRKPGTISDPDMKSKTSKGEEVFHQIQHTIQRLENSLRPQKSLDQHIRALPQELKDHIFNYFVTIIPDEVEVDGLYKPPVQLHVNQASRKAFAPVFYKNATFKVRSCHDEPTHREWHPWMRNYAHVRYTDDTFCRWLRNLNREHRFMIRTLVNILDEKWKVLPERPAEEYVKQWASADVRRLAHQTTDRSGLSGEIKFGYMWESEEDTAIVDWCETGLPEYSEFWSRTGYRRRNEGLFSLYL